MKGRPQGTRGRLGRLDCYFARKLVSRVPSALKLTPKNAMVVSRS